MLIYLLIVINFQSWSDPFVIITALPAAIAGIVWMLHTSVAAVNAAQRTQDYSMALDVQGATIGSVCPVETQLAGIPDCQA